MTDLFMPAPEPKTELGRYRILSSTAGVRVSPLQLGAMSIGDAWSGFMGSMNKENSMKLLDAFEDAGGNFIDTANNYQDEQSEEWIGEWMVRCSRRNGRAMANPLPTGEEAEPRLHGHRDQVHHQLQWGQVWQGQDGQPLWQPQEELAHVAT